MTTALIKIELPVEQVNVIMGALGKAPFEVVAALIQEIQKQAQPQLQPPAEAT